MKRRIAGLVTIAISLTVVLDARAQPARGGSFPAKPGHRPASRDADAQSGLEPRAIELVKSMSKRLAAAKTLSFTAVTTYESPSRIGPPLAYTTTSAVVLERPDKLRVVTPGDGPASEFYDDGRMITAFEPSSNLAAVADAPPTIDGALEAVYNQAALYFPFTDVIVADPYEDLADGLRRAFVMGRSSVVGGVTTDIVVLINDEVFAQLWIGADDKLPRRIRAVFARDPLQLRHDLELRDWGVDVAIPAGTFQSARAAKAKRIDFARPDPKPPIAFGPAGEETTK